MSKPFRVMVYDRALKPLYSLPLHGAPGRPGVEAIRVAPRLDAIGTASIDLPLDHPRARDLHEHGRRVRIWDQWGGHLLSGPVTTVAGKRDGSTWGASALSLSIEDDNRLLWRTLGWVAPLAGIDQQQSGNSDAVYRLTSVPAETAVKRTFRDNAVTRLGIPVTVLPDLGRGATMTYTTRNHTLADRLYPTVTEKGLAVEIRQEDDGSPTVQRVVLDVRPFTTHPQIIDDRSPQVTEWEYTVTGPEAMWGVAGGQGEGDARVFKRSANQSELNGWGALYGGEFFNDQRQESNPASVQAALDEELLAKSAKASLSLTLQGTDQWSYGRAWRVGDVLTTRIVPGANTITTQIASADLSWTPGDGLKESTQVGSTGKTTQAQIIKALARAVRDLQAGR